MKLTTSDNRRGMTRDGFTLMELMIVVTLLVILTGIVSPVFSGTMRDLRSDNSVRKLVSIMEYAQTRAVTDAAEYRVFIAPEDRQYWLEKSTIYDGTAVQFERVFDRLIEDTVFPEHVDVDVREARQFRGQRVFFVSFFPNGMCDEATIRFADRETHDRMEVSVRGSKIVWERDE